MPAASVDTACCRRSGRSGSSWRPGRASRLRPAACSRRASRTLHAGVAVRLAQGGAAVASFEHTSRWAGSPRRTGRRGRLCPGRRRCRAALVVAGAGLADGLALGHHRTEAVGATDAAAAVGRHGAQLAAAAAGRYQGAAHDAGHVGTAPGAASGVAVAPLPSRVQVELEAAQKLSVPQLLLQQSVLPSTPRRSWRRWWPRRRARHAAHAATVDRERAGRVRAPAAARHAHEAGAEVLAAAEQHSDEARHASPRSKHNPVGPRHRFCSQRPEQHAAGSVHDAAVGRHVLPSGMAGLPHRRPQRRPEAPNRPAPPSRPAPPTRPGARHRKVAPGGGAVAASPREETEDPRGNEGRSYSSCHRHVSLHVGIVAKQTSNSRARGETRLSRWFSRSGAVTVVSFDDLVERRSTSWSS